MPNVPEEYDPEFVKLILEKDAAPIEAVFNNIESLLKWLEEDE